MILLPHIISIHFIIIVFVIIIVIVNVIVIVVSKKLHSSMPSGKSTPQSSYLTSGQFVSDLGIKSNLTYCKDFVFISQKRKVIIYLFKVLGHKGTSLTFEVTLTHRGSAGLSYPDPKQG